MAITKMVVGLILEGKEKDFCVGCAYGQNHRKQIPWNELRKRLNYLGTLCTLTCVVQCNKPLKVELTILFCFVQG
jgi:hypothetical protein